MDANIEVLRATVAAELAQHATATGDARFRLAAAILRGRPPGRRHRDDALAVAEMKALVDAGYCATPTAAARKIVPSLRERISEESTISRLTTKYRATYG
jgi:hypothetical protein